MRVSTSVEVMMKGPSEKERSKGTGAGWERLCGAMNGRAVRAKQHVTQADGGHHHEHAGAVEQAPQHELGEAPTEAASPTERTRANQ